jgi:hypothetical protein
MKSYTDISQSKKLSEILPLESSDMRFCFSHTLSGRIIGHYPMIGREPSMGTVPCWSLAALLNVISNIFKYNLDYNGISFILTVGDFKVSDITAVDACYEMILKLKEKELI